MKSKIAQESLSITTEIVLPNDTNNLNNLMGGRLLHWMDIATAIAAHRHCGRIVVTAAVNNVSFTKAIPAGSIVTLEASGLNYQRRGKSLWFSTPETSNVIIEFSETPAVI